jgi:hypothetical protein
MSIGGGLLVVLFLASIFSRRSSPKTFLLALLCFAVAGCTQYWVRPDTGFRETSRDIVTCRSTLNQGVHPWRIEQPCMVGKGYNLSYDRPTVP